MTPPPPRRHTLWGAGSLTTTLGVVALFVLCCWSAAADAQGAIAFVMLLPFFGIGLALAVFLARRAVPSRIGKVSSASAKGLAVFIAIFYVTAMIPGLRGFSSGVVRLVASGYALATGKSPYAADKGL